MNKILREDEAIIKNLENDRTRLLNINNELKLEIRNLTENMRNKDETIDFQNKELNEAKSNIERMEINIKNIELKNSELKNEISDITFNVQKESRIRSDRERDIENLNKIIKEKENDIKKFLDEIEFIQNEKNKLYEDNTKMFNEIDSLKNHIYVLTDQNQQVLLIIKLKRNKIK